MIKDKYDIESVEKIINMGYPNNESYLDELLSWACDPNWPVAAKIYDYFIKLGKNGVEKVKSVLLLKYDYPCNYSLITQIIDRYPPDVLEECTTVLKLMANQAASDECDLVSLQILAENKLISFNEIKEIGLKTRVAYESYIAMIDNIIKNERKG